MAFTCCSTAGARTSSSDDSHYKISLRFRSGPTEAFFVRKHVPIILNNLSFLCMLAVFVTAGLALYMWSQPASGGTEVKTFSIAIDLAILLFDLLGAIVFRIPRLFSRVPPAVTEAGAVVFLCINSIAVCTMDFWYAARLHGRDPEIIWPTAVNFSDTRILLGLTALVLGTHMVLPVRWLTFLPLALFTVLLYGAFAFVLGSPDGEDAWTSLILFIGILACAVFGRRTIERHQREALLQLINERNLRVQTEFQLSQAESRATGPARGLEMDRAESVRDSRPDTTDSARIFDHCDIGKIEELGRKEQWYIGREELTMGSHVLGEGGFGSVVAGALYGASVAVKMPRAVCLKAESGESDEQTRLAVFNEVRLLRRLRHPNIVLFFGACVDDTSGDLLLVLEHVLGLPLQTAVLEGDLQKEALGPLHRYVAIRDLSLAFRYLHSRHPCVVHGDLKASNTFAEMAPGARGLIRAKLLDFGLARALTRHAKPLGGSLMWMAPEVALRRGPAKPELPSDVFSFGRLVFFVTTGRYPCERMPSKAFIKIFSDGHVPPLVWPSDAGTAAQAFRLMAEACSSFNADERPTMQSIGQQLDDFDIDCLDSDGPIPPSVPSACSKPLTEELTQGEYDTTATSAGRLSAVCEETPQEVLAMPMFKATPQGTVAAVLCDTIGRINFTMPTDEPPCCLYHAALQNMRMAIADLEALECKPTPFKYVRAQCPFCQMLLQPDFDGISGNLRRLLGSTRSRNGNKDIVTCPTCGTTVELNTRQAL